VYCVFAADVGRPRIAHGVPNDRRSWVSAGETTEALGSSSARPSSSPNCRMVGQASQNIYLISKTRRIPLLCEHVLRRGATLVNYNGNVGAPEQYRKVKRVDYNSVGKLVLEFHTVQCRSA